MSPFKRGVGFWLLLVLCGLVILIAANRRVRHGDLVQITELKTEHREASPKELQSRSERSPTSVPSSPETRLFTSWTQVDCSALALLAPIGGLGSGWQSTAATPDYLLARLTWEATLFGFDPEAVDLERRSLGIVLTVDRYLYELAGLEPVRKVRKERYYFPGDLYDGVKPPSPENIPATKQRLWDLYASDSQNACIDRLPPQHKVDGVAEVVRLRALSILSSLGPDPRVADEARKLLSGNYSVQQKAVASSLLLSQGLTADVEQWLTSSRKWEELTPVLRALAPSESRLFHGLDARNLLVYGSHISSMGRDLDHSLLGLLERAPEGEPKTALAAVLAGRTDNPSVRSAVLNVLDTGDDEAALAILRQRPPLMDDVRFRPILDKLLTSKDLRVKQYALESLSLVSDPAVLERVATYMNDANPLIARMAVRNLTFIGKYDPIRSIELVKEALRSKSADLEFVRLGHDTLRDLAPVAANYDEFVSKNATWLESQSTQDSHRR